jgi:hypothetical protein
VTLAFVLHHGGLVRAAPTAAASPASVTKRHSRAVASARPEAGINLGAAPFSPPRAEPCVAAEPPWLSEAADVPAMIPLGAATGRFMWRDVCSVSCSERLAARDSRAADDVADVRSATPGVSADAHRKRSSSSRFHCCAATTMLARDAAACDGICASVVLFLGHFW